MKIEMWDINRLKPYPGNPRHHTDAAIDKAAALLKEYGFRAPIVVDEDEFILAGHRRRLAALKLKLKKVPVHVAVGLTAAQAKAFRIADNRISEDSDWAEDDLKAELAALDQLGFDLELTGFDKLEIEDLCSEPGFEAAAPETQGALDSKANKICPKCGHEFEA